jgi:hypothetical protein
MRNAIVRTDGLAVAVVADSRADMGGQFVTALHM